MQTRFEFEWLKLKTKWTLLYKTVTQSKRKAAELKSVAVRIKTKM